MAVRGLICAFIAFKSSFSLRPNKISDAREYIIAVVHDIGGRDVACSCRRNAVRRQDFAQRAVRRSFGGVGSVHRKNLVAHAAFVNVFMLCHISPAFLSIQ